MKELSSSLDQYAENTLKNGNINSLVIATYRNGEVYQQYYVALDKNAHLKPNDATLYVNSKLYKEILQAFLNEVDLKHTYL